jgi:hypothetical protein
MNQPLPKTFKELIIDMYWQYMKFMVDGLHKTGKNAF